MLLLVSFLLTALGSYDLLTEGSYDNFYFVPFFVFGFLALGYSLVVKRKEWFIYGFLLFYFLVPHAGNSMPFLGRYIPRLESTNSGFLFRLFALNALTLALWRTKAYANVSERAAKRLILFFLLSLACASLYGIYLISAAGVWSYYNIDMSNWIQGIYCPLLAAVFYLGLRRWIVTFEQQQVIVVLLAIAALLLVLELTFEFAVPIASLNHLSFHDSGRFNSIIYLDFDEVGLFAGIGFLAWLYLAFRFRSFVFSAMLPMTFLVCYFTYQRTAMFSPLIACVPFALIYREVSKKTWLCTIGLFLVLFTLDWNSIFDGIVYLLQSKVREADAFGADTLMLRFALWMRALDAIIYSFPFGVGEGFGRYFMFSPDVPKLFSAIGHWNAIAGNFYSRAAEMDFQTNSHNIFTQFFMEYGVMGLFCLALLGRLAFSTYRKSRVFIGSDDGKRLYLAAILAMLVMILIYSIFDPVMSITYVLVMLLVDMLDVRPSRYSVVLQDASAPGPTRDLQSVSNHA